MRRLMLALLTGAYLCLSLVISLALWRMGAAPAVGLAAFIGAMGLCFAVHGVIAGALQGAALRVDIETIREAHGILLEQVEKVTPASPACWRPSPTTPRSARPN
jgi:cyclic-di-GMP phosphodiesterase TipF (flagellum assembly factor)